MSEAQTFTRGRRLAIATNVLLASVLAPALAGILCYVAYRPEFRARWDLTPDEVYTLSDQTRKVLGDLEQDVEVYTCFQPSPFNRNQMYVPGLAQVQYIIAQHVNDIVRQYELHSDGRVRAYLYDPQITGHLGRIEELARRLGEPPDNVVLVRAGDRQQLLRLPDLADYDDGQGVAGTPGRPRLRGFRDEESVTSAILAVTESRKTTVAFVTGHGERNPNAHDLDAAGRGGYRRFGLALYQQNLEVGFVELMQQPLDPDEVDVLVLASPTHELSAEETTRIQDYVQAGGNLLYLFDPETPVALDYPILDQLLGLRRWRGVVARRTEGMGHVLLDPFTINTDIYGIDSEVVKVHRARGLLCQFHQVAALQPLGDAVHSDLEIRPLAWTPADAWLDLPDASGEYNQRYDPANEGEGRGKLVLGYHVVLPGGGRAVVFGDSHFLDDQHVGAAPGNRDLGLNAVEWLAKREQLISIRKPDYTEVHVDLQPEEEGTILFNVIGVIPAVALVAALIVFWNRRS